jgi:predicted MFS family arabinose efflux permease
VSPRRVRVILLALSTAIFVTISYESMPIGLLTDIAAQLHTDTAGGGLLVSSYALVVVIGSIPLSAAVARYDARTVLLAMLVVFALSSAMVAASTTLAVAVGPAARRRRARDHLHRRLPDRPGRRRAGAPRAGRRHGRGG